MQGVIEGLLFSSKQTQKSGKDGKKAAFVTTFTDLDNGDKVLVYSPDQVGGGIRDLTPRKYIIQDMRPGTGMIFASAIVPLLDDQDQGKKGK